jgi:hypothetical protein
MAAVFFLDSTKNLSQIILAELCGAAINFPSFAVSFHIKTTQDSPGEFCPGCPKETRRVKT